MKRVGGIALVLGVIGLAAILLSPLVLKHVAFFRVKQIELVGLEYLDHQTVLDALDLADDRSLFDSPQEIVDRALAVPGIVAVTVNRQLPGTLRITFDEQVPVAYGVMDGELVPLDADAMPLPYDPLVSVLDLPLIHEVDPRLTGALAVVRSTDLALFEETEVASIRPDSTMVLQLPDQRLLLKGVPTIDELSAIADVRRYLDETSREATEIDTRFQGTGPGVRRVIVREGMG